MLLTVATRRMERRVIMEKIVTFLASGSLETTPVPALDRKDWFCAERRREEDFSAG
jgi:hypothetical protein